MLVLPPLRSVPYAVLIYGVEVWRPLDRWRRTSLERAAVILAISDHTVRKAREANPWLPEAKVVWLGAAERQVPVRKQATPIVLILGRMVSTERYKGHDALIDAWPRVLASVPTAQLVIAGDGDDRARLEARAAGYHFHHIYRILKPGGSREPAALLGRAGVDVERRRVWSGGARSCRVRVTGGRTKRDGHRRALSRRLWPHPAGLGGPAAPCRRP